MSLVVFWLSFEIKFLKVVGCQTLGESEYRRLSDVKCRGYDNRASKILSIYSSVYS
jgi:hypothetical protein